MINYCKFIILLTLFLFSNNTVQNNKNEDYATNCLTKALQNNSINDFHKFTGLVKSIEEKERLTYLSKREIFDMCLKFFQNYSANIDKSFFSDYLILSDLLKNNAEYSESLSEMISNVFIQNLDKSFSILSRMEAKQIMKLRNDVLFIEKNKIIIFDYLLSSNKACGYLKLLK